MRRNLFIVFLFAILHSHAQEIRLSLSVKNAELVDVISEIEEKTKTDFFYRHHWVDSIMVNIEVENVPLTDILDQVLGKTSLLYFIKGKNVYLTNGTPIVSELPIAKGESSLSMIPKGLIFKQDYANENSGLKSIIEIGTKKEANSRKEVTIAGYIKELSTGNPIEGALIYILNPMVTALTDSTGFYNLTLPKGKQNLLVQFLGMETLYQPIVLFSDGRFDALLETDVISLSAVTIRADRDANVQQVTMGVSKISVEQTKNVPLVLGERDILKIATTTAGVQTLGEGSSGFNVRGGKADQNLILFDGATIYNTSHFFGFFSVFNSDAISDMNVFKSSIPSEYGGRLSSVFDIHSLSADKDKFSGVGGVSPVTSKLTLQIPIIKEKSSLLIGGRATYSNWMLRAIQNGSFSQNEVSFGDFVANYDHKINQKNRVGITAYSSVDKFRLRSDSLFSFSDFSYNNNSVATFWDHQFSDKLTGQVRLAYSNYNYLLGFDQTDENAFEQKFGINDYLLSTKLNQYFKRHELIYGGSVRRYGINPGSRTPFGSESNVEVKNIQDDYGIESAINFEDQYKLNDRLSFSLGFRYSFFMAQGPSKVYSYMEGESKISENRVDSTDYKNGEVEQSYHGLEPRMSARLSLSDQSSVKFSYNRNRQYLHNLSNSASISPTDIWVQSDTHIKPQISDQISVGFYQNLFRGQVEISVESYYKWMENLIDIKVGAEFLLNPNIETVALQGDGKAYGLEFSVKKNGKLNGWINYSYARSFIRIVGSTLDETINNGKFYPSNYDKPHNLNLVANYKVTRRLSISYNLNYSTGRPTTFPVGVYDFKGSQVLHYSDRNAFRIPDYFRMDLGINLEEGHLLKKLTHSYWSFSIYNLLGRDNPFSVFFDVEDSQVRAYKVIVFGNPIPTLSFNFSF